MYILNTHLVGIYYVQGLPVGTLGKDWLIYAYSLMELMINRKKDHENSIYNVKVHKNIDKWNNMISGEEEILGNFNFTTSNTSRKCMAFIWLNGWVSISYIRTEVNGESQDKNFGMGRLFIVAWQSCYNDYCMRK